MAEFTDKERFFQLLEEHYDLTMQFLRTKTKDVSQVELVSYDEERMNGILTVFNWQGVKKVVAVPPGSLVETLTNINDDLRRRCEDAAEAAEYATEYANAKGRYAGEQGDYAMSQGDAAAALIELLTDLGLTVETQGQQAVDAMNEVIDWYSPFSQQAENWFSDIVTQVTGWFSSIRIEWNSWFSARVSEWNQWWNETTAAWNAWYAASRNEWNAWFAARKLEWPDWFNARKAEWSAWWSETTERWAGWSASAKSEWNNWYHGVTTTWDNWYQTVRSTMAVWERKEQERQSAEQIRQELADHPPVPSTRGYWMFWDMTVTPHAYVESGYSSRGTLDWPEFFWDYETMGIGVVTERDYSRFFIDEQGRFCMLM